MILTDMLARVGEYEQRASRLRSERHLCRPIDLAAVAEMIGTDIPDLCSMVRELWAWKNAVEEACIVQDMSPTDDPKDCVNRLLCWAQQTACDPMVSEPAAKLHAENERLKADAERWKACLNCLGTTIVEHQDGRTYFCVAIPFHLDPSMREMTTLTQFVDAIDAARTEPTP